MEHANTRVEWTAAITLHVDLDAIDPHGHVLRGSAGGDAQLLVGSAVRVLLWQPDAAEPVHAKPGSVVRSVIAAEISVPAHAQAPAPAPAAPGSAENDDTIIGRPGVEAAGVDHAGADDAGVDDAGIDGAVADTVIGASRPRPSAHVASESPVGPAVRLPDGRVVPLDRIVYVGRSPRSPRIASGAAPALVAVPSPLREISGTHLEIEVQGGVVVVRDLGSTNGTHVSLPGALRSLLSPGDSRVVPIGTRLELGDSTVLEIVPGATVGASW